MSILDALLGTQAVTAAPQTNALGFPVAQPGTGYKFDLPAPQQTAQPQAPSGPYHGLGGFLDRIGDALGTAMGIGPIHEQRYYQKQQTQALQGFLTNPDQAIAQLMQIPGQAANAIDLYKAVHPASETPLEIKLLKHLKEHPEDAAMLHQIDAELHPGMMTPVTIGQNDIYDPTGASVTTGDVTATGPNGEKIRLNRQTGQWEPVGGQTATPSGGFR